MQLSFEKIKEKGQSGCKIKGWEWNSSTWIHDKVNKKYRGYKIL